MSTISIGIIAIVAMLILFLFGMPVGFAMGMAGFLGLIFILGPAAALSSIVLKIYTTSSEFSFTVIPFFILMGEFARVSGLAKDIYVAFDRWLRWMPGGLGLATISGCALFGAICGSSVANAATMGAVSLPEMRRFHYDESLATGTVAAGGTLGFLIPPSVALIIYAIITGESAGKLLLAGILPGVLLAITYMAIIVVKVTLNPDLAPVTHERFSWKERVLALKNIWGALVIFFLVMGGIYLGFFTPTEAGAVGASGLFVIALARRKLTWSVLLDSLRSTAQVVCMLFVIIISAFIFSDLLALSRIPTLLADFIAGLEVSRYAILGLILLFFLVLGCLIESIPMLILTMPILLPVITRLGFDPVWFGIVAVLMVEAALITPPVGLNVYVIAGVAKDTPLTTIFRGVIPFLFAIFAVELIITLFPSICLILPGMMR